MLAIRLSQLTNCLLAHKLSQHQETATQIILVQEQACLQAHTPVCKHRTRCLQAHTAMEASKSALKGLGRALTFKKGGGYSEGLLVRGETHVDGWARVF